MKKNILKFAALLVAGIQITSCDFLNIVPNDIATLDHAFEDRAQAEKYLFTCYSYLPPYMDPTKDPAIMGSGEFLSYETGNGAISLYNLGLITGGQNISSPICNNWESDSWYESPYRGIRICNTFLEKIDEPFDLNMMDKTRWIAEAKFLKAYYNYCLIRMYGPIVIQDKNHPVSAGPDEVREYRTPLDSCINYVVRLLDEAAKDLPLKVDNDAEELGRATQPIAKAVKAKVLMLAASPIFNGNPTYANIIDERGIALFPAEYDAEKWKKAADACFEAITCAEDAGHTLYSIKTHQFNLNEELNQQLQMRYKIWDAWNTETIWGYTKTSTYALQYNAIPRLHADALKNSYVKGGALAPTQFVADLFYTENGVPMNEDKSYDYDHRYELRAATEEEKWKVSTAMDNATGAPFVTAKMHYGREPRFYATLGFDGALWWGNGKTDIKKYDELYTLAAKFSQLQGQTWGSLYSVTGYFAKKLVHPETTFNTSSFTTSQANPFPIIRVSDLYLLYAEALNEYYGPANEDIFTYVDAVREKAGLAGVKDSWRNFSTQAAKPESKDGLRDIIQRERMIELALEGQTMWDIRRWLRGTELWNGAVSTWNITGKLPEAYYMRVDLSYARNKFSQRDYLWPISQSQRDINPKLVQNYGW